MFANISLLPIGQKFVQLLQPHTDSFDGIALSIYPAMYFDTITPCGNNCTGKLDPESALEAIVQAHNAFPDKEIHIIEPFFNISKSCLIKIAPILDVTCILKDSNVFKKSTWLLTMLLT